MKFVLAVHGTRGDVEPCAAVGVELRRRGHAVHMAVPPNLIEFVESAGLTGVAYGPDSDEQINTVAAFVRNLTRAQNPLNLARAVKELFVEGWAEMGTTLTTLADGADLVMTGQTYHGVAANVAEYYDIPAAALHHFPMQVNGQIAIPSIPTPATLVRATMKVSWRLYAYVSKDADRAQRRELGLPPAPAPAVRRLAERGAPEIQAYDPVFFPGLAAEWSDRRPFVGPLTMELHSEPNEELESWIAAGTPPIYFGFGSTPVQTPVQTLAMISDVCAQLGERALIYSPAANSTRIRHADHVKRVGLVNYSTILPKCRAVVHHGAPVPPPRPASGNAHADSLGRGRSTDLGRCRPTTQSRLCQTLYEHHPRVIAQGATIDPGAGMRARAREISTRMTRPTAAVTAAADLLEATARQTPGSTPSSSPGR